MKATHYCSPHPAKKLLPLCGGFCHPTTNNYVVSASRPERIVALPAPVRLDWNHPVAIKPLLIVWVDYPLIRRNVNCGPSENQTPIFAVQGRRNLIIPTAQKWRGLSFANSHATRLFLSMPPRNIECIPFNLIYRWCYSNGKVFAPTDELAECTCKSPRWLARMGSNHRQAD